MKKILVFLLATLFWGCDGPHVSLIVDNKDSGTILIDGIPLSGKIKQENLSTENQVGNYYLDLKTGVHHFEIVLANGERIFKTLDIKSGEAYLHIDLISGITQGFE